MKTFRKEDVVGKTVIETSGDVKGKVEDVVFDLGGTIALVVKGADGKSTEVNVGMVTGISEHVIVKSQPGSGTPACKFCGAPMAAGERWCAKCGKSQA